MKWLSWRWWFENRHSGAITIAQFPNWPLFAIAGGSVLRVVTNDDSTLHRAADTAVVALWLFWGADELARGVNPWRRFLGTLVILWQLRRVLG